MEKLSVNNIVRLPIKPRRVSQVRSRDEALEILLPKFLGILWETGKVDKGIGALHGNVTAFIDGEVELGGFVLGYGVFGLHAYAPTARSPWTKVFSAHLGDPSVVDPSYFPYWGGRCCILSWKRGRWEDRIVAKREAPRTVAHLLTAGLARCKNYYRNSPRHQRAQSYLIRTIPDLV
jgi:hypothetical protein